MKRICSWCNALLSGSKAEGQTTHSICPSCFESLRVALAAEGMRPRAEGMRPRG